MSADGFTATTLHSKGIGLVVLGVAVEPRHDRGQTDTLFWSGSTRSQSVVVAYTAGETFPWVVRRTYWANRTRPEAVYRGEATTLDEATARVELDEDMQVTAVAS